MRHLQIPHVTQVGNNLTNDCGAAMGAALLAGYGLCNLSVAEFYKAASGNLSGAALYADQVRAVLSAHGLPTSKVAAKKLEYLYAQLATKRPCMLLVKMYGMGHFVNVLGLDIDCALVSDPMKPDYTEMPISELMAVWNGFAPKENPNGMMIYPYDALGGDTEKPLFLANVTCTVRVRNGPGLKFQVIGRARAGSRVSVYETKNADNLPWARIGAGQWVCQDYIKDVALPK